MRISDWSSDVCSSDLRADQRDAADAEARGAAARPEGAARRPAELARLDRPLLPGAARAGARQARLGPHAGGLPLARRQRQIGRASCRGRVCQYVYISVVAAALKTKHQYQLTE